MRLRFRWIDEERPGPRWAALFARAWPSYRRWFLREGAEARPSLATCRRALEAHMPELVPLWEELSRLAGGGEEAARMLSLYRPTPYLSGCSQAVWSRGAPLLVRNYDYHPAACEGTFLRSAWSGTDTMAASDCLWGVLDGLNEHGLTVALAFGGRTVVGDGFGIPLVLRYVLELCRTTEEAAAVLERVPCNMAYNVSLLDSSGARAVVYVAPDRPPLRVAADVATNHQLQVEWSQHDAVTRSAEREGFLAEQLADPTLDADAFVARFLEPPLFSTQYARGFGTLYTAVYRPVERAASFLWRGGRCDQRLDGFREQQLDVVFPR